MEKINTKRNSSLEILRIFAAMGVIVLHYNDFANEFIVEGSFPLYYTLLTNCVFSCSVNIFILISAFFLSCTSKRKISKVVELIIQFVLFRAGYYVLLMLVGKAFFDFDTFINLMLPVNYYIVLYSVLYVISPYINVLLERLSDKEFKKFLVLMICLFSVETWGVDILYRVSDKSYDGLSTVGLLGSQNGFTIVNFVLLYFIGAYIRRNYEKISQMKIIKLIGLFLVVLFIMYILILTGEQMGVDLAVLNYNNPLVIALAILLVMIFLKGHIENKIINELAKATFTCYIVHGTLLPFIGIERAVQASWGMLLIHQLLVIPGMYMFSYIIYKMYAFFMNPINNWIHKKVSK